MAFVSDFSAPTSGYHLLDAGDRGKSLSRDHQLAQVSLVRSNGSPSSAGCYLVDMLRGSDNFSVDEHFVDNGFQHIPLASSAELEPGDLLCISSGPLVRVPVASVLHRDVSASTRHLDTPEGTVYGRPGPCCFHSPGISAPPTCSDLLVHLRNETPPCSGPDPAKPPPADRKPQPSLLERLTPDQRVCFLNVWHKPPAHLNEISFEFHGPG